MASNATLSSAQSSSVGLWAEATTGSNIQVVTGTSNTVITFTLATTGSSSAFNPNLPVAVTVLPSTTIQGASNSGLAASVGISSCIFVNSNTQLNVAFVTNAAANVNVASGTRILFVQNQGI